MRRVRVIDSHTGGEPTRLVVEGGPDLGPGTALERRERFRESHDRFRAGVVNEPRGFDAMVGAVLCPPNGDEAVAQVIFFNNVGYLGMCVHGMIGVAETLRRRGMLELGGHRFETPAGLVGVEIHDDRTVSVANVLSYRTQKDIQVEVPGLGTVTGDVAWGGNWFFLVDDHGQDLANPDLLHLTDVTADIRAALTAAGVVGADGSEVDHIELFAAAPGEGADSRNFVLCPGREYDRSPCGTGTSAKMACLAADGKLAPGQVWRQEGIVGSVFEGTIEAVDGGVMPTVRGRAWITAENSLLFHDDDPFAEGIPL
ncbi:MAG: hydroxyproline-2-epimerase [Acidobacteria bacterium]|nr:hydroxyproline-2-epimerase [Acidobacteriota bacterium]